MDNRQLADVAFNKGRNAEAVVRYKSSFKDSEADLLSLLRIAKCCMLLKLDKEALEYYDQAIKLAPSHATADTRKTCYLLEQRLGKPKSTDAGKSNPQISMRALGNKGRFGNQIFQYAFLKIYASMFDIAIGTYPWIGSYVFDICDPLPTTPLEPLRQSQVDMQRVLNEGNERLIGRDVSGYFQYHTANWNQYRALFQHTFAPSPRFRTQITAAFDTLKQDNNTLLGFHIRRGDFGTNRFPVSPTMWYLDWLKENWAYLDRPKLYVATDTPELLNEFSAYDPVSLLDLGANFEGFESVVDWMVLRAADIVGVSNSTFSVSAAMANPLAQTFLRPNFGLNRIIDYDPWNHKILDIA